MESILPSEIARLVLGYLEEQNCCEAAQSFLEHSTHLSECLAVAHQGKKFSTKVMGKTLTDLLEEYCSVNSLVAERLDKLPEPAADQLLQCSGLIQKLKFLIDATRSAQTVLVSITVPPQGTPSPGNNGSTGLSSSRSRSCLQSSSERIRRTSVRLQGQETKRTKEKEEKTVRIQPVEATSLKSLPGLSDSFLDSRSTQTSQDESCVERSKDSVDISDDFQAVSSSSHCVLKRKLFNSETDSGSRTKLECERLSQIISHDEYETLSVCTSTPKRKGFPCKRKSHSPVIKLKKSSTSEVEQNESVDITAGTRGSPCKRKSNSPVTKLKKSLPSEVEQNESVDITVLQQALLENKPLHEKIAENINRVMRIPGDGIVEPQIHLDANLDIPPTTCDSMMQELNQAIKTIVDQTEQDPLFERFLDEIIGPVDEEASSSPAGGDSDADDAPTSVSVVDDLPNSATVVDDAPTSAVLADDVPVSSIVADDAPIPATVEGDSSISATVADSAPTCVTVADDAPTFVAAADNVSTSDTVTDVASTSATVAEDCQISVPRCLEESNSVAVTTEIPLKQRLRSARNKVSESAVEQSGTSTPSSKEQRRKELALADQNAAAIQSIINANLESTIERPRSKTVESSKKISDNMTGPGETVLESVPTSSSANEIKLNPVMKNRDLSKDNNFQIVNCGENTVLPMDHNSNADLSSTEQNDVVLFDGNITYTNQMPTSSLYWDNSKSQFSVPVVVAPQPEVIKPVHDNSQSIVITVPSLLTQEVIPTSDKQINEPENGQQPSTSSIIVCSEQNVSQPPPTSPEIFGSSNFTTFGSRKLFPIAPKGAKIAVAEIPETGEKLVFRSLTKSEVLDFFNKDDCVKNSSSDVVAKKQQKLRDKRKSAGVRPSTALEFQKLVNTLNMSTETDISDNYICQSNLIEQTNMSETECNKDVSESELTLEDGLNMPISGNNKESFQTNNDEKSENKSLGKEQSDVLIALNLKQLEQTDTLDYEKTNSESHLFGKQEPKNKVIIADTNFRETKKAIMHSSPTLKTDGVSKSGIVVESNNEKGSSNKDKRGTKSGKEEEQNEAVKPRQTPLVQQHVNDSSRRLSLSTPRRRANHIRALDFGTPVKSGTEDSAIRRSNSAPRESGRLQEISVPEMGISSNDQRTKNVRSSLFKSPDIPTKRILPEELIGVKEGMCPIATRSPAPQLSGGWDKVTGAGLIFGDASPAYSFTSFENSESIINSNDDGVSKESINSSICVSNTSRNKDQNKSVGKDVSIEHTDLGINSGLSLSSVKRGTRTWDSDLRSIVSQDYKTSPDSKSASDKSNVILDKNVSKKNKKSSPSKKRKERKPIQSKVKRNTKNERNKSTKLGNIAELETSSDAIHNNLESVDKLSTSSETCLVTEEEVRLLESQLNSSSEKDEVCASITDNSTEQIVNSSKKIESCEKECENSVALVQVTDSDMSAADASKQNTQSSDLKAEKIVSPKSLEANTELSVKQKKINNKCSINKNENSLKKKDNNSPRHEQSEISKSTDSSATALVTKEVNNVPISESVNYKTSLLLAREEEILNISSSLQFMVTPRKLCPSQCPLTPRVLSPSLLETPISNFLREQQNMDFSMIPTPNFPPTPNIAVTPQSANSNSPTSYSSRLTDYSSCSSYYKPTNTPQKLLEQILIDECNRIEANVNNKVMYLKNCKTISDCSVELVDFRKKSKSPSKPKENHLSVDNVEISAAVQQTLANDNEEKARSIVSVECNMEAKPKEQVSSVSEKKLKVSSTTASARSIGIHSERLEAGSSENKILKRQKKSTNTKVSKLPISEDETNLPLFKNSSARKVTNNIKNNSNSSNLLKNAKQRIGHVKDKPFASLLEEKKKRTLQTLKQSVTKDRPKRKGLKLETSDDKKTSLTKSFVTTSDNLNSDDTIEISVIKNRSPNKNSKEDHVIVSHSKIIDNISGTICDVTSSANMVFERKNEVTSVVNTLYEAETCDIVIEKIANLVQDTDKSVVQCLKTTKSPSEKDGSSSPNKNKKLNMSVDMIASRLLLEAQKPNDKFNATNEYLTITPEIGQENEVHSDEISVEDFPNLHFSTDDDTENESCVNKKDAVTDLKNVPSRILKDHESDLQTQDVSRPKDISSKIPLLEENCDNPGTLLQKKNNTNHYTADSTNKSDQEKKETFGKNSALDHLEEETEPVINIEEKVHGNFIQITYQGLGPSKEKPIEEDTEKLQYALFYEDTGYTYLTASNFFDLLSLEPTEKRKKKTNCDKSVRITKFRQNDENLTKVSLELKKNSCKMLKTNQKRVKLDNVVQNVPEKEIKDQHSEKDSVKNSRESSNKKSKRELIQKSVKECRQKEGERNSKRSKVNSKTGIEEEHCKAIDSSFKNTANGGKRPQEKTKSTTSGEDTAKGVSNVSNEKKLKALLTCGTQSTVLHKNVPAIVPRKDSSTTYALVSSHEEDLCNSILMDNSSCSGRKDGVKSEGMKTLPPKKRKASTDEILVQPADKRVCSEAQRSRDLLKLVNVDMFLDKVHSELKTADSK